MAKLEDDYNIKSTQEHLTRDSNMHIVNQQIDSDNEMSIKTIYEKNEELQAQLEARDRILAAKEFQFSEERNRLKEHIKMEMDLVRAENLKFLL